MVQRISLAQFQSKLREAARKQQQAIDAYNREIRRRNEKVQRAVDQYNREVRAHNARVRANRQRIAHELQRLSGRSVSTRYVTFHTSVQALGSSYVRLEAHADANLDSKYDVVLDLSEREAANSVGVMNALLGDAPTEMQMTSPDVSLMAELGRFSGGLENRWKGAIFALNPHNPDAARHFCASAREVLTQILEVKAPTDAVLAAMPDCDRTEQGKPTRRARVRYFLHRKGWGDDILEEFIVQDVQNVVDLFDVLNDGTHGSAGKFDLLQLNAIRKRVEDGVMFLSRVAL